MTSPAILIVSPDSRFAESVHERTPPAIHVATTLDFAGVRTAIETGSPHCVLVDLRGVTDGGHRANQELAELQAEFPGLPLVLLVDVDCPEPIERLAVESQLPLVRGGDVQHLQTLLEELLTSVEPEPPAPRTPDSVGRSTERTVLAGVTRRFETTSPPLRRMLDDLAVAAAHDVTILLIGETGSGKTYLSNLIHEASPRRDEPFLHVACGALPRDLIEAELFGHARGAFTSAHADKDGKFVAARKGTVLLDEIDVLGPEQQVKLLRVIETGEFEPVGSNRTIKSQARLVVASNLDLEPLVEKGLFRPDLYYRLNMLKFDLPPLRKRKSDIIPLAQSFVRKFEQKHVIRVHRVDGSLLDALVDYPWPGNVRELEHVIQRAVIYCRDGVLTASNLPPHILAGHFGPTNDPSVHLRPSTAHPDPTLGRQVAVTEREIIEQSLSKNNFSRTITARELGISRVTLYNKMRKYNMMK